MESFSGDRYFSHSQFPSSISSCPEKCIPPPPPPTDTLTYRSEHDLLIGAANGVLLGRVHYLCRNFAMLRPAALLRMPE